MADAGIAEDAEATADTHSVTSAAADADPFADSLDNAFSDTATDGNTMRKVPIPLQIQWQMQTQYTHRYDASTATDPTTHTVAGALRGTDRVTHVITDARRATDRSTHAIPAIDRDTDAGVTPERGTITERGAITHRGSDRHSIEGTGRICTGVGNGISIFNSVTAGD